MKPNEIMRYIHESGNIRDWITSENFRRLARDFGSKKAFEVVNNASYEVRQCEYGVTRGVVRILNEKYTSRTQCKGDDVYRWETGRDIALLHCLRNALKKF